MLSRDAIQQDLEGILDVIMGAFPNSYPESERDKKKEQIGKSIDDWKVMDENGRIIAALYVRKDKMRIGRSTITKGDVGDVSVLPEYQGKGIGSELMKETLAWMKQSGQYDLSRLGGYYQFYARFGYLKFCRRHMVIHVGKTEKIGNSKTYEGKFAISAKHLMAIKVYDPASHFASLKNLIEKYQDLYNGSLVLDHFDEFPAGPLTFVYEDEGKVDGIMQAIEHVNGITDVEAKMSIYKLEYERDKPWVLDALIKYAYNYALEKGYGRITSVVNFEPRLIENLCSTGVHFKLVEYYSGQASNMLQIVNMPTLFKNLAKEFEYRISRSAAAQWKGIIEIASAKDCIQLKVESGKIEVVSGEKPDIAICLKEFYLLNLVLGLMSFVEAEVAMEKVLIPGNLEYSLVRDLFPSGIVCSGVWG